MADPRLLPDDDISSQSQVSSGPRMLSHEDLAPPRHGALGEIGSQFWNQGVKVELPRMIGQAMQYPLGSESWLGQAGKSLEQAATAREAAHPEWQPEPEKHGAVTNFLASGAPMIAQSVAPVAAVGGAIAALPFELPAIAGLGVAGALGAVPAGLSQAQQTYSKAKAEGLPEEQATAAARRTGLEEWGGETLGNVIAGRLLGFGHGAAKTAAGALQQATTPEIVKPFLRGLPEAFIGETATEMGQQAAESATERAYGIDLNQPSPWEAAKSVVGPTLGMTTLLAPFGLAGHALGAVQAQRQAQTLSNPDTDQEKRIEIARGLTQQIKAADPSAAEMFARNVGSDIAAGRPITLDEGLFQQRPVSPEISRQPVQPSLNGGPVLPPSPLAQPGAQPNLSPAQQGLLEPAAQGRTDLGLQPEFQAPAQAGMSSESIQSSALANIAPPVPAGLPAELPPQSVIPGVESSASGALISPPSGSPVPSSNPVPTLLSPDQQTPASLTNLPQGQILSGLVPQSSPSPVGEATSESSTYAGPERRTNLTQRQRVSEMSTEDLRKTLLTDDMTPLGNRRAYEESQRLPYQASADLDDFKNINTRAGHEGGDEVIRSVGRILHEEAQKAGIPAYRIGGDEYRAESGDEAALHTLFSKVRERVSNEISVVAKHPNGTEERLPSVGLSYGTGKDFATADQALEADKAARKAAGLRKGTRDLGGVHEPPAPRNEIPGRAQAAPEAVTQPAAGPEITRAPTSAPAAPETARPEIAAAQAIQPSLQENVNAVETGQKPESGQQKHQGIAQGTAISENAQEPGQGNREQASNRNRAGESGQGAQEEVVPAQGKPDFARGSLSTRKDLRSLGEKVLNGANADELYQHLIQNKAKNPLEAALAVAFKSKGFRPEIELVDGLENRKGKLDHTIAGQYRQSTDTVSINQHYGPDVAGVVVMHELLHSATVARLRATPNHPAVKAMNDLYNEVVDKLSPEQRAQFKRELENVREFITYGMGYDVGSQQFRGILKNLEVTPRAGGIHTAWQAFVDIVRRILGIDAKHTTALGELIELTTRVIEAGRPGEMTNEDVSFATIPGHENTPLQSAIREHISDLFRTDSKVTWLNKTLNTPYHLAQKFKEHYKPVFDKGQEFLSEVTSLSTQAESQAPELFRSMQSLKQATKTGKAKNADVSAAMQAIIASTLDDKRVYTESELRDRFHLTPYQAKLYQQARQAADTSADQMAMSLISKLARNIGVSAEQVKTARSAQTLPAYIEALYNNALKPILDQAKDERTKALVNDTISDINKVRIQAEQLKKEGYFPLQRFGRYTLHITDADGKSLYFDMYESRYARNRAERQMRQDEEFKGAHFTTGEMNEEAYQMYQGTDLDAMRAFAKQAGLDEDPIVQEFLRLTINNRSALKRMIHRKGIAGFSQDMRRVLASFILSNARYAARQYHMGDMAAAVRAIPKELGDLQKQAQRLYDYVNHPVEEFQKLRGFLFFNFLGGSAASALTNLTQVPLVAAPYFAQFGAGAVKSLLKWANPLRKPVGAMEQALKRAQDEGVVSPQEIYNLTATARGGLGLGKSRIVQTGLYLWGSLFSAAEQYNRATTFKAAYEVAEKLGESDPYAFAVKAVNETAFIYNKGNRPALGRGLGAPLMTFKAFSISYLEFMKRLPVKQRMLALALLTMAAGVEGLPFAGDFEDLIDTLAQWIPGLDKVLPVNSKKALREWAGQYLGEAGRDILLQGTSGIPGFPIDIQRRVGAENLIPGTALFKQSETDKTRDIREMFGAGAGALQQAVYGAASLAKGNLGGAAMAVMPKAVRDMIQGIDMATTGEYRDPTGKLITETTGAQAGFKALGFQPGNVADIQEAKQLQQQDINLHNVKEAGIADKLAQAIIEKRPELRAEAIQDMRSWNADHPDMRIVINPSQIRQRVRNAQMTAQQRMLKSTPREMRGQILL